jgi:hypothetical protein
MEIELKRVSLATMTEYDKKGKCETLKRSDREKAMQTFDITTKDAACGVLLQLYASLAVKLGDFKNVSADLSLIKMLHAGKECFMGKETKDCVSTFTLQYLETERGSMYHSESRILLFRLTVTQLAIFRDGPKV